MTARRIRFSCSRIADGSVTPARELQAEPGTDPAHPARVGVELVPVTAQRLPEGLDSLGDPPVEQPLGDHQEPGDLLLVLPVDTVQVSLGRRAADAGVLVVAFGIRSDALVLKRCLDLPQRHFSHQLPEDAPGCTADELGHRASLTAPASCVVLARLRTQRANARATADLLHRKPSPTARVTRSGGSSFPPGARTPANREACVLPSPVLGLLVRTGGAQVARPTVRSGLLRSGVAGCFAGQRTCRSTMSGPGRAGVARWWFGSPGRRIGCRRCTGSGSPSSR